MSYVSLEDLRKAAEFDVEVEGARYRLRALSLSELAEIRRGLPITDGEEGRSVELDETEAARRSEAILCRALVEPAVDDETVRLIPVTHVGPLVDAVLRRTASARPFGRSPSAGSSSPSTESGSGTAADPASS